MTAINLNVCILSFDILTPYRHEHREEHRAIIVEQQAQLWTEKISSEHQPAAINLWST